VFSRTGRSIVNLLELGGSVGFIYFFELDGICVFYLDGRKYLSAAMCVLPLDHLGCRCLRSRFLHKSLFFVSPTI